MNVNDSSSVTANGPDRVFAGVDTRRARRGGAVGALVLVAVTFVAYIPALRSGYIWDDGQYLHRNHLVQTPHGLAAVWGMRYDADPGRLRINTPQYYPLVYTTYWIEHLLWGLHPAGYHAVNVLLHAFSALLVWRITRRLGIPAGWFIAAVFALHPVQVESVAWITERKNVLSGLFYLSALLAFLRYFESDRLRWYLLALLLFVAALLSKTVTCTLPVVVLLVRWYQQRRIGGRDALRLMPAFVLGMAAGLVTVYLERAHVGAIGSEWSQTFLERALVIAPRAFAFYAGKIAWPHPLIFIYPRWEVAAGVWASYLPLAGVLLAFGVALAGTRRFGWGPLLLLVFAAVTLSPALGFFQVYPHRFSWVADHFQYLGSLGFIALYTLVVVWLGARLVRSRSAARAVAVCVLLVLAALTFRQTRSYENAQRLWQDTLAANPDAWIASLNLGIRAAQNGRYAEAAEYYEHTARYPVARSEAYGSWGLALTRLQRPEGALAMYEKAIAADPANPKNYTGLAKALGLLGRLDEAEEALHTALRLAPEHLTAWLNLGLLRTRQQRWAEAERCFERALVLAPYEPEVRLRYGELLSDMRRWPEAVVQYRAAQRGQGERFAAWGQLVDALYESGEYAEALRVCEQRLRDTPNDGRLLSRLAWIRATCPVDEIRDGALALRISAQLARAMGSEAHVLDTLACTYAEVGDFRRAVVVAEQALQAAKQTASPDLTAAIEARLQLFRDKQPYRHGLP